MADKTLTISLIVVVAVVMGILVVILQNPAFYNLHASEQKIKERLQDETLPVTSQDAEYLEKLALQNPTVTNFVKGNNLDTYCCAYSKNNNSSLVTLYFLDDRDQRQLSVIFDRNTLQIIEIDNFRPIQHTPIPTNDYSYQVIALKELPGKSFYYYKIEKLDEIPHLRDVYHNKTKIITSPQFIELLDLFYQKCLDDNPGKPTFCNDTPPALEYESKKYLFVSKGVDSISDGNEFIQNEFEK